MTTRIANLAANNRIVDLILRTQNRVHASEIRVSTGSASQDYIGIANQSERLADGQGNFPLGHGEAGDAIHETKHMFALIAEEFANRHGQVGGLTADQGRPRPRSRRRRCGPYRPRPGRPL